MRVIALWFVLVIAPKPFMAQQTASSAPEPRKVTATAGLGNAMGWLGVQAETYFAHQRASAFAGLGYTPEIDPGDPTGFTFAVGARGFTSGQKHRGFLEVSISQIAITRRFVGDGERYYGPGLQAGYQFVSRGGFTFMVSLGLGYALGVPEGESHLFGLGGLGLGYTWRSRTLPQHPKGAP